MADTGYRPFIRVGARMGTMEDPDLSEKHHGDPTSLALTDVRPKFNEKRLNITPLDIGPYRMGKDGLQSSLVLSSHVKMVLL
jgi:hypothetical protein